MQPGNAKEGGAGFAAAIDPCRRGPVVRLIQASLALVSSTRNCSYTISPLRALLAQIIYIEP